MSLAFADTSFYLALLNPRDQWHAAVMDASQGHFQGTVTSEYVLIEVANSLSKPPDRDLFGVFLETIRSDDQTLIVPAAETHFEAGLRLYLQCTDKAWSLTDRISFAIMKERSIVDALSSDHHFEQAGFRLLMRRES